MLIKNVFGVEFLEESIVPNSKMKVTIGNLHFVYGEECFNKNNTLNKRVKNSVNRLKGLLILKEEKYVGDIKEQLIHDMELRKAISKELIYLKSKGVTVEVMPSKARVA